MEINNKGNRQEINNNKKQKKRNRNKGNNQEINNNKKTKQ